MPSRPAVPVEHTPAPVEPPAAAWQARARAFVAWAEQQLRARADALAYLRGRGLTDETIRLARLGYNPKEWYDRDVVRWGIGEPGCRPIWLPRGWVIPCEVGGILYYAKIRRPDEDVVDGNKYIIVRGGRKAGVLYGLGDIAGHSDAVIVEGEINALTLRQCIAGVAAIVSVGDANNRPSEDALAELVKVRRWHSLYDDDEAGERGQAALGVLSQRVRVLPWPFKGRDINDARNDIDLAEWVLPFLGPNDRDKRCKWLEHHVARLEAQRRSGKADAQAMHVLELLHCQWRNLGVDRDLSAERHDAQPLPF